MDILQDFMLKFESVFTLPAFGKFVRLLQGFMQTHAPKALTELNSHLPQDSHFCGVYDFLNRYAWSHLDLAQRLLDWYVETLLQRQRFLLVVDDTKAFKPHARKMEGICWHPEHHRRIQAKATTETGEEVTATGVVGERGHSWVVLGTLHRRESGHWNCFPLRAGLFVREKYCPETFQTKLEIAESLFNSLTWPQKPLLVGDNFYAASSFVNQLDGHVLSHLKATAVAFESVESPSKPKRGRPQIYGRKVHLATELDDPAKMTQHEVFVYGEQKKIQTAAFVGRLRGHHHPVKIILVKGLRKANFLLFSTDLELSAAQMVEYYAARFQIEIAFRELKQDLGAFNYRLKHLSGFQNYLHVAFVAYALLKYLAIQGIVTTPATPWYAPKGLATPATVQKAVFQYLQALRIFQGLHKQEVPTENISLDDFMRLCAS